MAITTNRVYNDPALGAAFSNLASAFMPPGGGDLAGYASAAANVEMLQSDAAIKQFVHENRKHFDLRHVRHSGFDETANVAGDPFDFDFFKFSSFLIERNHIGKLHAELTVP